MSANVEDLIKRIVGSGENVDTYGSIPADGKFLFACYVGSRMYNLHTDESDEDFFMVWAASTESLLKIQSPWPKNFGFTFKNPEDSKPDYTIHELRKFLEMIIAGEPRCIDLLFVEKPEVIALTTREFEEIRSLRQSFVTQALMVKYSGMIKQDLLKLQETRNFAAAKKHETLTNAGKLAKRMYVVARNLYSCEMLLESGVPLGWLEADSPIHQELMALKSGTDKSLLEFSGFDEQVSKFRLRLDKIDIESRKLPKVCPEGAIDSLERILITTRKGML
eukprot:TRINITY_DN22382_c0_g1_i1.p1 TRINITY_DN22382_c0_g1~~TRINITY_DN22382_c0_g1_i1.p1  ORF type:complete len:278 (+),score=74.60 TRINITY_DN22382_c0_g1_i1:483-1316(+)